MISNLKKIDLFNNFIYYSTKVNKNMPVYKKKYQKRKYNRKPINKGPKLEKCPFVVGSNEYHEWKRERYTKKYIN